MLKRKYQFPDRASAEAAYQREEARAFRWCLACEYLVDSTRRGSVAGCPCKTIGAYEAILCGASRHDEGAILISFCAPGATNPRPSVTVHSRDEIADWRRSAGDLYVTGFERDEERADLVKLLDWVLEAVAKAQRVA